MATPTSKTSAKRGRKPKAATGETALDAVDESTHSSPPKKRGRKPKPTASETVLEDTVDEPIHSSPPNKRRRKSKARASETVFEDSLDEALSSSPPIVTAGLATTPLHSRTKRGRKGEVVDSEDFNTRSQARTKLLIELNDLLKLDGLLNKGVSPAFWACSQLADMNSLKELVDLAKWRPDLVLLTQDTLQYVPRLCELLDVLGHIEVVFNCRHAHG